MSSFLLLLCYCSYIILLLFLLLALFYPFLVLSLLFYPANCWAFTVLGAVTFASVTYISKYVSLGSLVAISLWFIEFVIWGCAGWLPLEGNVLYESYGVVFVITLLAFIRHSGNIKRLINGTERKIGQKKTEEANG